MECEECGGRVREVTGRLEFEDPYVGRIVLGTALFLKCGNCGQVLYPIETLRQIETERKDLIHQAVSNFPERDFVTSSEAAEFLGVTRQALNKNRRIRRGFVYRLAKSDDCTLFLKQSLEQYKKTGDGRFPLFPVEHTVEPNYLGDAVAWEPTFSYRQQESHDVRIRTKVVSAGVNLYAAAN